MLLSVKITTYDDLIYEIKKEILSAKQEILLRVWSEDYNAIEDQLREVDKRGVDIQLLSFTPLKNPIGR